jgi:putative transposase
MLKDKFQGKYRIKSARNPRWDYSSAGAYFVTICTAGREPYFGKIVNGKMELTEIGKIASCFWNEIPNHFPFVILDEFIIMPDHVHGIIIINDNGDRQTQGGINTDGDNFDGYYNKTTACLIENAIVETRQCIEIRHCLVSATNTNKPTHPNPSTPAMKRFRNQGNNTLSSIIGSYKSVSTKYARKIFPEFAWQSRFHDRIIRDEKEFDRIKIYILNNPSNW